MTRRQKKTLVRIIVSGVLFAAALIISHAVTLPWWAELLTFLPSYLIVGWDVLWKAARNIVHGQVFDECFLMSIATLGAFAVREFPEAAAVMLFYQVGELFQSVAVGRSRRSIAALMDIRPDHANVIRDGRETEVSPDEVETGEIILVKAGERIPLDGVIIEGSTSLDTAALTGESIPRDVTVGENAISGAVNIGSVIPKAPLPAYWSLWNPRPRERRGPKTSSPALPNITPPPWSYRRCCLRCCLPCSLTANGPNGSTARSYSLLFPAPARL